MKSCTHTHPLDRAEFLNKQFQSVFSRSEEISQEDFSQNYDMPTEEITHLVLMIYRKSLDTGEVLKDWQSANIIHAFK